MLSNDVDMPANDIIDINLQGIAKTKFRINGEPGAIIELNLSDLSIMDRLEKGMKDLQKEMTSLSDIPNDDEHLSELMQAADQKMRKYVDYIFDYPVSAVCAKNGTMYDPIDGRFRYEIIIDGLTKLYADNINEQYRKLEAKLSKHTDKYVAAKRKK